MVDTLEVIYMLDVFAVVEPTTAFVCPLFSTRHGSSIVITNTGNHRWYKKTWRTSVSLMSRDASSEERNQIIGKN